MKRLKNEDLLLPTNKNPGIDEMKDLDELPLLIKTTENITDNHLILKEVDEIIIANKVIVY